MRGSAWVGVPVFDECEQGVVDLRHRNTAVVERASSWGIVQCGERLEEQRVAEAAVAAEAGQPTRLVPEALVIGDMPE